MKGRLVMKKLKEIISRIEWSQVSPAVIARYVLGIISIINIILDKVGVLPIQVSDSTVYSICSIVFATIMIVVNTYKNNSTSTEAIIADRVMDILRASQKVNKDVPVIEQIEQVLTDVQNQLYDENNAEEVDDDSDDEVDE